MPKLSCECCRKEKMKHPTSCVVRFSNGREARILVCRECGVQLVDILYKYVNLPKTT